MPFDRIRREREEQERQYEIQRQLLEGKLQAKRAHAQWYYQASGIEHLITGLYNAIGITTIPNPTVFDGKIEDSPEGPESFDATMTCIHVDLVVGQHVSEGSMAFGSIMVSNTERYNHCIQIDDAIPNCVSPSRAETSGSLIRTGATLRSLHAIRHNSGWHLGRIDRVYFTSLARV